MKASIATLAVFLLVVESVSAQVIRGGGNPYSSQLMTDPDAGTIQGIQRYGRPLATDPAQGNGYPYFVFPSVRDPSQSSPFGGSPTVRLNPLQQLQLRQQLQALSRTQENNKLGRQNNGGVGAANVERAPRFGDEPKGAQQAAAVGALFRGLANLSSDPLKTPEDAAMGYLNLATSLSSPVFVPDRTDPEAQGFNKDAFIRQQPLIQIKLRVVEVARSDSLNVASTLDYISNMRNVPTLFGSAVPGSPNVNGNGQNLTGASRFNFDGLLSVNNNTDPSSVTNLTSNLSGGAGALVNLTSKHINLITSVLAEELEADVLTAPELVTTNGESVEFVAGTKSPFNLGTVSTNVSANGDAGRIENHVFYKHVGTYVRITPRIINFGSYATGRGDAPIVDDDVRDWNLLIRFLLNEGLIELKGSSEEEALTHFAKDVSLYDGIMREGRLVPLKRKTQILESINRFSKSDLRDYALRRIEMAPDLYAFSEEPDLAKDPGFESDFYNDRCCGECSCESGCNWKPEDCTIDLEVLARFSNKDPSTSAFRTDMVDGSDETDEFAGQNIVTTAETDVRAIANIVQIKNGTGVVMAGLLGENDIQSVAKIPILGDLPGVGFLFRAKSNSRNKSEILIFIEANVLSHDECIARAQSAEDLHLAAPYVAGEMLDSPFEFGLHRAGFGTYLPPPSCHEEAYWERCARRVRRIETTTYDALR